MEIDFFEKVVKLFHSTTPTYIPPRSHTAYRLLLSPAHLAALGPAANWMGPAYQCKTFISSVMNGSTRRHHQLGREVSLFVPYNYLLKTDPPPLGLCRALTIRLIVTSSLSLYSPATTLPALLLSPQPCAGIAIHALNGERLGLPPPSSSPLPVVSGALERLYQR